MWEKEETNFGAQHGKKEQFKAASTKGNPASGRPEEPTCGGLIVDDAAFEARDQGAPT